MAMGIETFSGYGTKPETTLQQLAGLEALKPLSHPVRPSSPFPHGRGVMGGTGSAWAWSSPLWASLPPCSPSSSWTSYPVGFSVAFLHVYMAFHYHMGPFHPRKFPTVGRIREWSAPALQIWPSYWEGTAFSTKSFINIFVWEWLVLCLPLPYGALSPP